MYRIAGSNLFGQWMSQDKIIDHFRALNGNNIENNTSLKCICWSYNVFKIKGDLYISGAFKGKENQFVQLDVPEELRNVNKSIAGNDYHLIIVDVTLNLIYIFDFATEQFKKVKFVEDILEKEGKTESVVVKVVATNNSCLYLTKEGTVFCGMLPTLVDTSHVNGKVIDIALGYEHFVLLTDCGSIYTWGNGRRLQLGHGNINNLDQPMEVEALGGIKITKISAGGWHTCALSEFGDLYVWGWNDTGQLGVKEKSSVESATSLQSYGLPQVVDIYDENGIEVDINIKDIACGSRHTVILLEDSSVWSSGCNKYGQLGFSVENFPRVDNFRKAFTGASVLLCGPWSTVIKNDA